MNNRNFDDAMNKLNRAYEQIPTQTSSATIMANIKKKKKKRKWARFDQRWQVAALIVLMIGIGYVLGLSQLSQRDSALQLESSPEQGIENNQTEMATVNEEEVEIAAEDMDEPLNESLKVFTEEESTRLDITNEEGFEETIQVKQIEDQQFGFSTRYDERLQIEEMTTNYGRALQWYFHNDNGKIAPIVFEIFEIQRETTYTNKINAYKEMMEEQGYVEVTSSNYLTNLNMIKGQIIEEFQFAKDGINEHVVSIEQGERYFFFKTSSFAPGSEYIEFSEGFGRNLQIIFEQFNWLYND
ncbi:hypothetical protein [Halalkalibacter krulwichiae]|uniref:Uncharacterized protein n=1 Tax=Halalkalibacter krulwichiae TaxID=199441 RepID=A0A1X9MB51_9BACI|nr:hypothetical protein [Halalkalibacter krulwichiae]ARK30638.1 hypothetical protein BkAM31D_12815 [Halalkalibacter krulwichiae]